MGCREQIEVSAETHAAWRRQCATEKPALLQLLADIRSTNQALKAALAAGDAAEVRRLEEQLAALREGPDRPLEIRDR